MRACPSTSPLGSAVLKVNSAIDLIVIFSTAAERHNKHGHQGY